MTPEPLRILLVDDDDVDVKTVKKAFERGRLSNEVFIAHDGVEALELLRSGAVPHDRLLVLLDLNMPRMNGIELLRELRADPVLRALPAIVLTTSTAESDRVEAFDLNVAGYLVKPVTFASFVELMSALDRYWSLVEFPPGHGRPGSRP